VRSNIIDLADTNLVSEGVRETDASWLIRIPKAAPDGWMYIPSDVVPKLYRLLDNARGYDTNSVIRAKRLLQRSVTWRIP